MKKIFQDPDGKEYSVAKKKQLGYRVDMVQKLYQNGPMSATDLASCMGLTFPTAMSVLNTLSSDGIVLNMGPAHANAGRKPNLYSVKADAGYFITIFIDLAGTKIIVYNFHNQAIHTEFLNNAPIQDSYNSLILIADALKQILITLNIDQSLLLGTCIVMPGLVNHFNSENLTYFERKEFSLKEFLSTNFPEPVWIENDAKAVAIAEKYYGQYSGSKNLISMWIDQGLGIGLILDGKLYRGSSGFAGELGHIKLTANTIPCKCGKLGCLETVINLNHLYQLYLNEINNNSKANINSASDVILAAHKGNDAAVRSIARFAKNLAHACAMVIQLLNPQTIVICGKLTAAGDYLLIPLRQELLSLSSMDMIKNTSISLSDIADDAANLGALKILANSIFRPIDFNSTNI